MVIPNLKKPKLHDPAASHGMCAISGIMMTPGSENLGDPFTFEESQSTSKPTSPEKPSESDDLTQTKGYHCGGIPQSSPTKLIGDFDRLSMLEDKPQRISPSPKAIGSRKEKMHTPKKSFTQGQNPLQVYEDPVQDSATGSPFPRPRSHTARILEELTTNEPTRQHRAVFDHQLLAEEPDSPDYHRKWLMLEAAGERRRSAQENVENPRLARKILDSAIERINAKTLEVHGFRKLQGLIRTSSDVIWENGYKFDELINLLLDYLETPSDASDPRTAKAQDLKVQVLVTVRLLLQYQPKYFSSYFPRALTAVLSTRRYYNSTSHIVCGLEETAESIVHQCDPAPCINSVLDLLESEDSSSTEAEPNTMFMGLYVLAGLLHRTQQMDWSMRLSGEQQQRLGDLGAKCLNDINPDIRRAVIEFVLELYGSVEERRFWTLVTGDLENHRALITYYLARKKTVAQ